MPNPVAVIGSTIGAIIVVAGITWGSFALYEGSWDLAQHNANHTSEIIRNGFNYQSTLGDEITKGIQAVAQDTSDIAKAQQQNMGSYANDLKSQREADVNTVCEQATQVNAALPPGQPQTNWINTNCESGSVSPSSVYYYTGN